jgi:hypothetical protein
MINIPPKIAVFYNAKYTTPSNTSYIYSIKVLPLGSSKREKLFYKRYKKRYPNEMIIDNKPSAGFMLDRFYKSSFYSHTLYGVVKDPRGVDIIISEYNVECIIQDSIISNGLINDMCVWTREDDEIELTLTPLNELNYKELKENSDLINSRLNPKSVSIGDTVLLQNKLTGVYMGKGSLYSKTNTTMNKAFTQMTLKPCVIKNEHIIQLNANCYYYAKDLQFLKIINKASSVTTQRESFEHINSEINKGVAIFYDGPVYNGVFPNFSYRALNKIKLVSKNSKYPVAMKLEQVGVIDAHDLFEKTLQYKDVGMLVFENSLGERFIINGPYRPSLLANFKLNFLKYTDKCFRVYKVDIPDSVFYSIDVVFSDTINNKNTTLDLIYSMTDFVKYYKIVKTVNSDEYI